MIQVLLINALTMEYAMLWRWNFQTNGVQYDGIIWNFPNPLGISLLKSLIILNEIFFVSGKFAAIQTYRGSIYLHNRWGNENQIVKMQLITKLE